MNSSALVDRGYLPPSAGRASGPDSWTLVAARRAAEEPSGPVSSVEVRNAHPVFSMSCEYYPGGVGVQNWPWPDYC